MFSLLSVQASFSEVVTWVVTDVPRDQSVTVDFGCEFESISSVEITMTSNMGEVYLCGEDLSGPFSYPCGNLTEFYLGEEAHLAVNGFGEIDHQTWSEWLKRGPLFTEPVTDWSYLNSGVTYFLWQCYGAWCSPDWIHGEGYCWPDIYQVHEIKITVTAGSVATRSLAWGEIKALYR